MKTALLATGAALGAVSANTYVASHEALFPELFIQRQILAGKSASDRILLSECLTSPLVRQSAEGYVRVFLDEKKKGAVIEFNSEKVHSRLEMELASIKVDPTNANKFEVVTSRVKCFHSASALNISDEDLTTLPDANHRLLRTGDIIPEAMTLVLDVSKNTPLPVRRIDNSVLVKCTEETDLLANLGSDEALNNSQMKVNFIPDNKVLDPALDRMRVATVPIVNNHMGSGELFVDLDTNSLILSFGDRVTALSCPLPPSLTSQARSVADLLNLISKPEVDVDTSFLSNMPVVDKELGKQGTPVIQQQVVRDAPAAFPFTQLAPSYDDKCGKVEFSTTLYEILKIEETADSLELDLADPFAGRQLGVASSKSLKIKKHATDDRIASMTLVFKHGNQVCAELTEKDLHHLGDSTSFTEVVKNILRSLERGTDNYVSGFTGVRVNMPALKDLKLPLNHPAQQCLVTLEGSNAPQEVFLGHVGQGRLRVQLGKQTRKVNLHPDADQALSSHYSSEFKEMDMQVHQLTVASIRGYGMEIGHQTIPLFAEPTELEQAFTTTLCHLRGEDMKAENHNKFVSDVIEMIVQDDTKIPGKASETASDELAQPFPATDIYSELIKHRIESNAAVFPSTVEVKAPFDCVKDLLDVQSNVATVMEAYVPAYETFKTNQKFVLETASDKYYKHQVDFLSFMVSDIPTAVQSSHIMQNSFIEANAHILRYFNRLAEILRADNKKDQLYDSSMKAVEDAVKEKCTPDLLHIIAGQLGITVKEADEMFCDWMRDSLEEAQAATELWTKAYSAQFTNFLKVFIDNVNIHIPTGEKPKDDASDDPPGGDAPVDPAAEDDVFDDKPEPVKDFRTALKMSAHRLYTNQARLAFREKLGAIWQFAPNDPLLENGEHKIGVPWFAKDFDSDKPSEQDIDRESQAAYLSTHKQLEKYAQAATDAEIIKIYKDKKKVFTATSFCRLEFDDIHECLAALSKRVNEEQLPSIIAVEGQKPKWNLAEAYSKTDSNRGTLYDLGIYRRTISELWSVLGGDIDKRVHPPKLASVVDDAVKLIEQFDEMIVQLEKVNTILMEKSDLKAALALEESWRPVKTEFMRVGAAGKLITLLERGALNALTNFASISPLQPSTAVNVARLKRVMEASKEKPLSTYPDLDYYVYDGSSSSVKVATHVPVPLSIRISDLAGSDEAFYANMRRAFSKGTATPQLVSAMEVEFKDLMAIHNRNQCVAGGPSSVDAVLSALRTSKEDLKKTPSMDKAKKFNQLVSKCVEARTVCQQADSDVKGIQTWDFTDGAFVKSLFNIPLPECPEPENLKDYESLVGDLMKYLLYLGVLVAVGAAAGGIFVFVQKKRKGKDGALLDKIVGNEDI